MSKRSVQIFHQKYCITRKVYKNFNSTNPHVNANENYN